MTAPAEAFIPRRRDIAADLLRRKSLAERNWNIPAAHRTDQQYALMRYTDRANAEVLRRIMADHGWPGRTLVGPEAARAAWLIAQHYDDPVFQKLALEKLTQAVRDGEAGLRQWAYLYDRCCVHDDLPQLYGTQFRHGPEGLQPHPVADPATLDARRAQIGLKPYADQAAIVRQHHSGEHPV